MKPVQVLFTIHLALAIASGSSAQGLRDPFEILNRNIEAIGGLQNLKAQKTTHIVGELDLIGTGLKGSFEEWSEPPIRSRQEVDLKVLRQVSGDNGEYGWAVDRNGKLQVRRDEESINNRKVKSLRAEYEYLNPKSDVFTVAFEGVDTASGKDCYVIRTLNTLNSDTTSDYYDTATFMRLKSITRTPESKSEIWFSDFREVEGSLVAFKQEMIQTPPGMKQLVTLNTVEINVPIDASLFDPPGQDIKDFRFTNGDSTEAIPFEFIENHIYLPVEVGGKTRLWALDTGAGATTIDEDFARELGLKLEGKVKGQGASKLVDVSFTTLPSFSLNGLEFDEQSAAAIKIGWLFDQWLGTEVVGILGYDFLSRVVTRVDYANETLTFYNADSFNYQGDGVVIPAPVNRRKMMDLPVTVDGKYGGMWSLDLGAGGMGFHYPFAKQNGLLDAKGVAGVGFGAGGAHPIRRLLAKTMELGGFIVNDIEILVPVEQGHGAFGNMDLTGNIGNTLLRHFVLYIDYKNEQVILEKGDGFDKPVPRDNSGMRVINVGKDSIQVLFVADNTPAAKAGFKKDDLISSINGIPVENLGGVVSIYRLLRQAPGTELKIEVARGNEKKKLTVTLKDLFG